MGEIFAFPQNISLFLVFHMDILIVVLALRWESDFDMAYE